MERIEQEIVRAEARGAAQLKSAVDSEGGWRALLFRKLTTIMPTRAFDTLKKCEVTTSFVVTESTSLLALAAALAASTFASST